MSKNPGSRSGNAHADPGPQEGHFYVIRVREPLAPAWSVVFAGFAISRDADGNTVLSGNVIDRSALYGVFSRVRDLGLTIIAVERSRRDRPLSSPTTRSEA